MLNLVVERDKEKNEKIVILSLVTPRTEVKGCTPKVVRLNFNDKASAINPWLPPKGMERSIWEVTVLKALSNAYHFKSDCEKELDILEKALWYGRGNGMNLNFKEIADILKDDTFQEQTGDIRTCEVLYRLFTGTGLTKFTYSARNQNIFDVMEDAGSDNVIQIVMENAPDSRWLLFQYIMIISAVLGKEREDDERFSLVVEWLPSCFSRLQNAFVKVCEPLNSLTLKNPATVLFRF